MARNGDAEMKENEVPLLGDERLYPNCPGCKCAHLSARGAGPPVKELLMVSSVILCNGIPIHSLIPFLYFMIDDFHIAKRTEDIGYYAGAVVSIFMVGRIISSVPWGIFADKYGRRPVFLLGLLSILVLQPIFGSTKNYWVALVARFLLGTFNGILGPIKHDVARARNLVLVKRNPPGALFMDIMEKAYASELCSPESQAWGLNVVSTTWSLGLMVGPAIGGFLARPVVNFPGIFSEDSIFGSYPYLLPSLVQAGFAVIELVVVYYLPETVHYHDEEKPSDIQEPLLESKKPVEPSLWLNWPLMASVTIYSIWGLHDNSFSEIFSMWCVSPKEVGGLALRTSDVGSILSISGFGMICVQLVLFPPLAKILGPILVTRVPIILAIPVVLLFPAMQYLHGKVQWLSLSMAALARNSLSVAAVTGTFMLVNNAVDSKRRGAANGISLSCVSIFRAIGLATGGAIFAWSQSRPNAKFLPGEVFRNCVSSSQVLRSRRIGSQVVFVIQGLICVTTLFITFPPFLPKHLDEPYSELNEFHHQRNDKKNVRTLQ